MVTEPDKNPSKPDQDVEAENIALFIPHVYKVQKEIVQPSVHHPLAEGGEKATRSVVVTQLSGQFSFANPTSIRRSHCLWAIEDDRRERKGEDLDVIQILIEDIARLPIITNPHQELCLGIHLKAVKRLSEIISALRSEDENKPYQLFIGELLLQIWESLERQCIAQELPPPNLEMWASELLVSRRNVHTMHRSRIRRFIRRVQAINESGIADGLLGLVYQVVEILALLPGQVITQLTEFININQGLPLADEWLRWLPEDPKALEQQVRRRAKQIEQLLATGYLRYALRVAQGFVDQGVDFVDLVQAGFIGLLRAAKKFNYQVQVRFGAYATSWIWQAVGREIADQGRTIRLPVHIQESLRKWETVCERFDDGHYDPTSNSDILFHAGFLEQDTFDNIREMKELGIPFSAKIEKLYEHAVTKACKLCMSVVEVFSLEEVRFTITSDDLFDEVESVADFLPDEDSILDNIVDFAFVRQVIEEQLFPYLTDRECEVLELRYGWTDGKERTLEEVGSYYNLTRERIRQIEAKAFKKLQNRLALGMLPKIYELIPEHKSPISWWVDKKILLSTTEAIDNKDNANLSELERMLSRLPRSHWHDRQTGIQVGQRREQLIAALQILTIPAHVSDITEQVNEMVEGKELDDTHVYNLLIRDEETFVLLGQGNFSLIAWEKARAKELQPVIACCPMTLPDPPDYEDSFFESVLIGQQTLAQGMAVEQFINSMLNWAKTDPRQQKWFLQNILSAYYLVDLIPYVFYFGGENPILSCTLPSGSIQHLRYHCLNTLSRRLVAMPEFWWLLQQRQPVRPVDLGDLFTDIHPYGLDDVLQRLRLLVSLGAAQKLKYGSYRLTSLGEDCANRWKKEPIVETAVVSEPDLVDDFGNFIEW